jgi:FAD/FMN-containing dehydrogenase
VGLVRHGGLSIKNATGYNLTAAVAGSAGRLGVVLSAVFRLVPRPPQRAVDWFGFERPTRLWSAARAGGEVGALPGEQPIDAPAVIASLTLPPGRPLLVVELDDATADGLARRRALVQERLARLGGRAHNPSSGDRGGLTGGTGSGWVRQVAAVAPTDLYPIAAALTAAATRTSLTGHLLLEATGGTLELAVEPSVADRLGPLLREAGVPVRTPAVAAFAQRLAAAFDPDGLLRPYPDPAEDAHRGGNV